MTAQEAEYAAQMAELAIKERQAVEERARPLRDYLNEKVLPYVTEGLYEMAKVQPEDPVDFLAEYLFRCSTNRAAQVQSTTPS